MSWDFWMEIDTGGPEPVEMGGDANYTWNCAPMYYKLFEGQLENGIRSFDGMQGSDALPLLNDGIARMTRDFAEFEKLNPENGWGSAEGALDILKKLRAWCESHPKATLRVV